MYFELLLWLCHEKGVRKSEKAIITGSSLISSEKSKIINTILMNPLVGRETNFQLTGQVFPGDSLNSTFIPVA